MSDKKQIAIKERILKQAMEFWGVIRYTRYGPRDRFAA